VTHGIEFTRLHVLLYTVIMVLVTLLPWLTGMSGLVYLAATVLLDAGFVYYAVALKLTTRPDLPMRLFRYSVQYLMWLFLALLVDHYVPTTQWTG
jgi:protoheme IX farnesyltransferase